MIFLIQNVGVVPDSYDLDISDTPEFSETSMIFLETVGLDINFRDLLHRKFNFSFRVTF